MSSSSENSPADGNGIQRFGHLATFLFTGFAAGGACGMLQALRSMQGHAYWTSGMYGLIAEHVLAHMLPWIAAGGLMFAFFGLTHLVCGRMKAGVRAAACAACVVLSGTLAVMVAPRAAVPYALWFLAAPCALLCVPGIARTLLRCRQIAAACSLACLLVLFAAAAWPGMRSLRAMDSSRPNIVLVVIDCLRPDHLGCYGYGRDTSPVIDTLAQAGWVFENAHVTAPWTKPSVASLFSSLLPERHGLVDPGHTAPDRMLLLAEVLRNEGYENFFINGGNVFLKKEFNLHQGFHHYDYLPQRTQSAADVARALLRRAAAAEGAPWFAYVHFMDAHAPYTVNRHNTRYAKKIIPALAPGDPATMLSLQRAPDSPCGRDPSLRRYFLDLYDGQIRYVDEALGFMVQGLGRLGRLDNTLFIITADHGEEFWEHGSAEHGHTLYNELLHVPLIIAGPPVRPGRFSAPVQLIDLMPTVLDLADIPRGRLGLQGISLAPGSAGPAGRPLFASATLYGPESYCIMRERQKLIYRTDNASGKWKLHGAQAPPGYELFDLARDPNERENRAAGAHVPAALENLLSDYIRTEPLTAIRASIRIGGDDLRRQLESLGYVQ